MVKYLSVAVGPGCAEPLRYGMPVNKEPGNSKKKIFVSLRAEKEREWSTLNERRKS